ncbi:ABC transporter permease [Desulfoscipio gibsoniae]
MKRYYLMTLLVILVLNFSLPRLMPGDPFLYLSVEDGHTSVTFTEEQIAQYKAYYGLDKPVYLQFFSYIGNLLRADLGYSIYFNTGVMEIISTRILWTVSIVLCAIVISCFLGTLMGGISAWYRDGPADKLLYPGMVIFSEIPSFLMGVFLLFVFAARLGWFPMAGGVTPFAEFNSAAEQVRDIVRHGALPVITLSLSRLGGFYLLSRSSMLNVLSRDYMRTARAKGLKSLRIIFKHALKNALLPIVTRVFMSLGTVFGAAVLVENVFSYPGVGRLIGEAVMVRDYVLIQGVFFFITITVLTMNWLADLLYRKLDPRIS